MNVAKEGFLKHYDQAQKTTLKSFNSALKKITELEAEYCGNDKWYDMSALALYLTLRARYARDK